MKSIKKIIFEKDESDLTVRRFPQTEQIEGIRKYAKIAFAALNDLEDEMPSLTAFETIEKYVHPLREKLKKMLQNPEKYLD